MSSGAVLRWARAVAPHLSSQLVTAASLQRMDNLLDIVRAALPSAPLADPLAGGVAAFVQSLCGLGVVKAPLAAEVMRNVLDGDCMMLYVALIRFVALRLLGVSSERELEETLESTLGLLSVTPTEAELRECALRVCVARSNVSTWTLDDALEYLKCLGNPPLITAAGGALLDSDGLRTAAAAHLAFVARGGGVWNAGPTMVDEERAKWRSELESALQAAESLVTQCSELQNEVDTLQLRCDGAANEAEHARRLLLEGKQREDTLAAQAEGALAAAADALAEAERLEHRVSTLEEEKVALEGKLSLSKQVNAVSSSNDEVSGFRARVASLEQTVENLERELEDALKAATEALSDAERVEESSRAHEAKVVALERENATLAAKITSDTMDRAVLEREHADLARKLALLERDFSAVKTENSVLRKDHPSKSKNTSSSQDLAHLAALEKELASLRANMVSLEEDRASADRDHAAREKELADKCSFFEQDHGALTAKVAFLEKERAAVESKNATLKKENTSLSVSVASLKKDRKAKIASLEKEHAVLVNKYAALEKEHTALAARMVSRDEDHSSLERDHAAHERELAEKLLLMEKNRSALESEVSSLRELLKMASAPVNNQQDSSARVASLENHNAALVKEAEEALESLSETLSQVERLELEKSALQARVKSLEGQLDEATAVAEQALDGERVARESERETTSNSPTSAWLDEKAALEAEKAALTARVATLEREVEGAERSGADGMEELLLLQLAVEHARMELQQWQGRFDSSEIQWKARVEELELAKSSATRLAVDLSEQLDTMRTELANALSCAEGEAQQALALERKLALRPNVSALEEANARLAAELVRSERERAKLLEEAESGLADGLQVALVREEAETLRQEVDQLRMLSKSLQVALGEAESQLNAMGGELRAREREVSLLEGRVARSMLSEIEMSRCATRASSWGMGEGRWEWASMGDTAGAAERVLDALHGAGKWGKGALDVLRSAFVAPPSLWSFVCNVVFWEGRIASCALLVQLLDGKLKGRTLAWTLWIRSRILHVLGASGIAICLSRSGFEDVVDRAVGTGAGAAAVKSLGNADDDDDSVEISFVAMALAPKLSSGQLHPRPPPTPLLVSLVPTPALALAAPPQQAALPSLERVLVESNAASLPGGYADLECQLEGLGQPGLLLEGAQAAFAGAYVARLLHPDLPEEDTGSLRKELLRFVVNRLISLLRQLRCVSIGLVASVELPLLRGNTSSAWWDYACRMDGQLLPEHLRAWCAGVQALIRAH